MANSIEVQEQSGDPPGEELARGLLQIVRELTLELHPTRAPTEISLDSALERELGFDSLSRAELLLRVERAFNVGLSERLLASAETPRDLLRAVLSGRGPRPTVATRPALPPAAQQAKSAPHSAQTLTEVLDWHVQLQPDRTQVYLYGEHDDPEAISYKSLRDSARAVAAGLVTRGLQPAQTVAIMLPTGRDYLSVFLGILYAGGIPVPIYPPVRASQIEDHLRRHAGILANAGAVMLITVAEAKTVARLLKSLVPALQSIILPSELARSPLSFVAPALRTSDIAFLQYTSGSTGQPKGVVLTHADLLANIRAMGRATRANSDDVFVSWLPLYHDMGLIGAWLGSLYYAMTLVLMSPLAFLARPQRWLWTIDRHRGTLAAGPNFAYELCLNRIPDRELEGIDLSSVRMLFNGAEPVSPQTLRRFAERFAACGLRREALAPVYGLAEVAVGLAFPPIGRGPLIDRIRRREFLDADRAVPADADEEAALEYVACGQPLPGYEVRVVDGAGRELPDRHQGRLQFRGPSATSGYFRNPEATRALFDGDWLESGDLAYIADGDIYLTSRIKDVIIRSGRNLHPYEVEAAVGSLEGVRKGCVAVFGSADRASGTERLVVMAETRELDSGRRAALESRIRATTLDLLGQPPDEVVLAPPRTVLKTSSGKIRRAASRDIYEQGGIGGKPRWVWWQILRLVAASARPGLRRFGLAMRHAGFAAYMHALFWLLAPAVWLLVVLLPRASWRWSVMRAGARLLMFLARIPLRVDGLENLPTRTGYVLAANHASYLDGIVMVAALNTPFCFVAKSELARQPIARMFLSRVGVEFVERFDKRQGVTDARRTAEVASGGRALLFFPEGTLRHMPGLMAFHLGAFAAATEAGVPVVPVSLRGTRSILRDGSWFPRSGSIAVRIAQPIAPEGGDWAASVRLRDATRREILRHVGEPDLAGDPAQP